MWKSLVALIILSFCLGTAAWLIFLYLSRKGRFEDLEDAKYRMLEEDDAPLPPEGGETKEEDRK